MIHAALLATALQTVNAAPATVRLDELNAVSTMIDGHGPYHFLLDTGAGITVITPELAARIGLSGAGSQRVTGGGGSVQVQRLDLSDVRIGKAEVHHVAAVVIPLPPDVTYQGDYGRIDGVIGYSFLSHFAVTIDMKADTATFSPAGTYRAPPGANTVPADLDDNTPIVAASVDGISGTFKLDTGDSGVLTLAAPFEAAHHAELRYSHALPVITWGVGGFEQDLDVRLHSFALGGTTFPDVITTLSLTKTGIFGSGTKFAGNVGDDILNHFVFTIDYPRRRVDFTPEAAVAPYHPYKQPGFAATRQADGTFRIVAVIPHSPASQAGLRTGDVLLTLDGDPLPEVDTAQIKEALRATEVTYTVRSAGKTRSVTLVLSDLLPAEGK
jgi:Aspartyl protease/PDZ domain